MSISKKVRFEVFKRDSFTCQYCGSTPPSAVLEVDHIIPKSKKGKDDVTNLVTSCFDCNRGKSNRKLKDKPCRNDIKKINKELQEKYEQLKQYYKHKDREHKQEQNDVNEISTYWDSISENHFLLSDRDRASIKVFLKNINKYDIMDFMDLSLKVSDINGRWKYFCACCWRIIKGENNADS